MESTSPGSSDVSHAHQESRGISISNPLEPEQVPPPHLSQLTIDYITPTTLPSFRRLISLLLPIRYPDGYYNAILKNPHQDLIARVALWADDSHPQSKFGSRPAHATTDRVIGGICCRVEPSVHNSVPTGQTELYISTIAVLSPYRGKGIATKLLESVLEEAIRAHGVGSVYAHVWAASEDALLWYEKRGFKKEVLVESYYRRLNPQSAWILRRKIGVEEHLIVGTGK